MTIIKKAPLMAFRLGFGLVLGVIAMSSFKADKKLIPATYYNAGTIASPNWQLNTRTLGGDPGNSYFCDEEITNACTVVSEGTPSGLPSGYTEGQYTPY